MMPHNFGTVITQDGGDFLDGKLLLHGTKVNVRWPEGGSSTHTIEYHPVSWGSITGKEAEVAPFLILKHKGVEFSYSLRGSTLMLVRSE